MVGYELDDKDKTVVRFEIEPSTVFRPAGPDEIAGRIRDAVAPAVAGARAVLEQVKQTKPRVRAIITHSSSPSRRPAPR